MLLRTAFAFFVLALLAGLVGFFGLVPRSASFVQILFFVFLSGFLVLLLMGLATERRPAA